MLIELLIGSLYVDQYLKDKQQQDTKEYQETPGNTEFTVTLSIDDRDVQTIKSYAQTEWDD